MSTTEEFLGWIPPSERTPEQQAAHETILMGMRKFRILGPTAPLPRGVKVCLFDAWKAPDVVADLGGNQFSWFHQLTGSCVGAGGGNALFSLIAVQRLLATNPTKAFIPFWPIPYGLCRADHGDKGQGEGAMGSWFADTLIKRGVVSAAEPGLPQFQTGNDGYMLSSQLEMQYSDGTSQTVRKWLETAAQHPLGAAAETTTIDDMRNALVNGYPLTFACLNNVSSARVAGTGDNALLLGKWDRYGPHQQSVHAFWDHPFHGPVYWAQNNWPRGTYPQDPAGGPMCGCWVKEVDVKRALQLQAEVYALSHLKWFPAQPNVINSWADIIPRRRTLLVP